MKALASAAVLGLATIVASPASSEDYPARPVHIVAPAGGTPEQFRKVIGSDIGRWRGVVKQANVKVE
jgi:tripartite-type tricarboxylate transporter receptor subunit TctC